MTAKKTKSPKSKAKSNKVTASSVQEAQLLKKLIERKGITLWDPSAVVATVLSVGRIPFAPGTWGSLAGVVFFPLFLIPPLYVNQLMPSPLLILVLSLSILVLLYSIGVMAIKTYQTKTKTSDAPEIVYDEFFGQILTYCIAYTGLFLITKINFLIADRQQALVYEFVPFIFFRLFDVCKPWPINIIDRKENSAWGVMFDDVVAAVYAAAASIVVFLVMSHYI